MSDDTTTTTDDVSIRVSASVEAMAENLIGGLYGDSLAEVYKSLIYDQLKLIYGRK